MRKGVSPVVATVLLIAIAVIAAVAVWYWVSPMTSSPPGPSTGQSAIVVTGVYKNASNSSQCISLDINNPAGLSITPITSFEVRFTNGTTAAKYIYINATQASGATVNYNVSGFSNNATPTVIGAGSYLLRAYNANATGYGDAYFTC
jgi:flagellin-like protein